MLDRDERVPRGSLMQPNRLPSTRFESRTGRWESLLTSASPIPGTAGASYLGSRGLDADLVASSHTLFGESFFGRPAVLFPLTNAGGATIGVHGRYIDDGEPRMRSAGNRRDAVFVTGEWQTAGSVAITEAPIDALSVQQLLDIPSMALCGTSWPDWMAGSLVSRRVYLAFDADGPGDNAAFRLGELLRLDGGSWERLRPRTAKDWNDVLRDVVL